MKSKVISLMIFIVIAFYSCKKYPEGGNSSWAKSKIIGTWDVENLTVDGIDSTANFKANPNYCEYPIIIEDINDHDDYSLFIFPNCSGKVLNGDLWEIPKNKKKLIFYFEYDSTQVELYPILLNEDISINWIILRLNNKQLWVKSNFHNKEYFLKLNKKPE